MTRRQSVALLLSFALGCTGSAQAVEDPIPPPVALVVQAGRPLRVALDGRIRVKRVGQPVTGRLVEAVYAYDRIVVPVGTRVVGHVARLDAVRRRDRLWAALGTDFSPPRRVTLQFDSLLMADGSSLPVRTEVISASERLALHVRETPREGLAGRVAQAIRDRASQAIAPVKEPGRLGRLKQDVLGRLPFHRQYVRAGTVYTAVLLAPLDFGAAPAIEAAPPGTVPPPESILRARLLTPLDSARTPRGSPVRSVVTEPLFSADHRLILPEGTVLSGEVTFARAARRFHRNGQLRFLIESVQAPEQASTGLRASLYSVQAGRGQRIALDEEGGATIVNSPRRFAAPALAGLALGLSLHQRLDYDTDGAAAETAYGRANSQGIGGFLGLGLVGAALSQVSRPFAIGLGVLGVARTTYSSVAGCGRNVSFLAETVIEVQLGREPPPAK